MEARARPGLSRPGLARPGLARPVEILLAVLGLVATAPFLAFISLAVLCSSRGPILFRQERVGRNGHPFTLLKFRSMTVTESGPRITARGDARVTVIGRVLRATKLDELPELWNILRGDMSFVGPRPEVPDYVDREDPLWAPVLEVRPGLTDPVTLRLRNEERLLAQVEGDREDFYRKRLLPWKLRGYADYLHRRTAGSDLAVLAKTLLAVLVPSSEPPPTLEDIE